jgi:hypothetical protein
MKKSRSYISNITVAYNGATTSVAAVFTYSIIIMIYAIFRSSATIYSNMPNGEKNTILWINGFSVAYSVVVFSFLMAVISSLAGAITAVVLKKILLYFNPLFIVKKAFVISCITSLTMLIILYLLLHAMLKSYMTFKYAETFLFWFLFPSVIYFIVSSIGAIALNKGLSIADKLKHQTAVRNKIK